jgi:hypothetical protein
MKARPVLPGAFSFAIAFDLMVRRILSARNRRC